MVYRPAIRVKTVQRILDPTEKTRELVLEPESHIANDWTKMAGFAVLRDGEDLIYGEIHWYQGKHIGRVEFKLKRELPKMVRW